MLVPLLLALGALNLPVDAAPTGGDTLGRHASADGGAAAVEAPAGASDDGEAEDAEFDELRALEEAAIDPGAQSDATLRATLERLGYGSLVRDRLEAALEHAQLSGDALDFQLAPVTDLATFDVALVKDRYDIPVEMRPLVAQYIQFFQGKGRKWFQRWMARSTRYIPLMQPILEAHGLPRDTVYLSMIESGFNTQARSWARAVGPWQFIPGTAKMFALKEDFWVDERRDPVKATHAAANYLAQLYANTGHWYLAWAGYNTGGGRVRRLIETYGTSDFWELSEHKRGFAKETKHYVPKLIACALVARHPEAFGFSKDEFDFQPAFTFDEVQLTTSVDLDVLARAAGTTVDELEGLNPELKRWCTPPATDEAPYRLRLPPGTKARFAVEFPKVAPTERLSFKIHRVGRGDTLSKIARSYHSAPEAILQANRLASARALKLGAELIVPVPSAQAIASGKADASLERQVARARRAGVRATRPEDEVPAGSGSTGRGAVGGSVAVTTEGGKKKVSYGVASGDSLWSIARRFDVRVADLREWNAELGSSRGLKVGSSLTVWPGAGAQLTGTAAAPPPAPSKAAKPGTKHTVASGDTLWTVSQKYGCTVAELKRWNRLKSKALRPGQVLVVAR
jgi:membrane-bound lytic murein transglycosylase D